ncbi:hypothetical protein RJ640_005842 [Escallonia rubra]|uniref:Thaumatin-like protein n=1 Tax=Escallonia rubra TaxID=112253 RepID=A0AA88SDW2_9ASTE|nr:hypothetical protein RJ640_005842 [Escallonia rubra]
MVVASPEDPGCCGGDVGVYIAGNVAGVRRSRRGAVERERELMVVASPADPDYCGGDVAVYIAGHVAGVRRSQRAGVYSTKFKLENECSYTVWPRVVPGNGTQPLTTTTPLKLEPGESASIFIPVSWFGQLWARTRCSYDITGRFTCLTGDCGTGSAECDSAQTVPPVTVAEFNISGNGGLDFYSVSATRGYNLAMLVVPQSDGEANCMATACVNGPNGNCPYETSGSCTTTCFAFGDPKNCCSGAYVPRGVCKPSEYSLYFGSRCPWAPSYVYDENDGKKKNRAFACSMADYLITFCPHPSLATG